MTTTRAPSRACSSEAQATGSCKRPSGLKLPHPDCRIDPEMRSSFFGRTSLPRRGQPTWFLRSVLVLLLSWPDGICAARWALLGRGLGARSMFRAVTLSGPGGGADRIIFSCCPACASIALAFASSLFSCRRGVHAGGAKFTVGSAHGWLQKPDSSRFANEGANEGANGGTAAGGAGMTGASPPLASEVLLHVYSPYVPGQPPLELRCLQVS